MGCEQAAESSVPIERVANTWPLDRFLEWTGSHANG
jgi:hypothetical protein